jgi:hypothetical protein
MGRPELADDARFADGVGRGRNMEALDAEFNASRVEGHGWSHIAIGFVVAAVSYFFVVKWLIRYVQTHTFNSFAGYRVIVHFANELPQATTIHWHGVRVPIEMDGVPDVSQPEVKHGETFTYDFVVRDAGLYWYHPHVMSAARVRITASPSRPACGRRGQDREPDSRQCPILRS